MKVSLVSITQSLITSEDGKKLTPEELLVYVARVSNPSNQLNTATADKLLGYLIKHKHWSPFDMANLTVEVVTSRAVAHQILRHWSIKPQEFSQRYAEATNYEDIELRLKADTNRQSSTDVIATIEHTGETMEGYRVYISQSLSGDTKRPQFSDLAVRCGKLLETADSLYKDLIHADIAPECARFILPLATQTTMYLNGSVRSWIHYLEQRTSEHAQKEHRLVAIEIEKLFGQHFPNVLKAIKDA